jgi:hypothetical protein
MDREFIAGELVKVARVLISGYEEDWDDLNDRVETMREDALDRIEDYRQTELKKIHKKYENHPDFSKRPNDATMELRKAIMKLAPMFRKLGHRMTMESHGWLELKINNDANGEHALGLIRDILKRHGVKTPSDVWSVARLKDADGIPLLTVY